MEKKPVHKSSSGDQETRKRKSSEEAKEKAKKSPDDNVEPRKRSRVSEQEEAVRSSPGPSEKKATGVKRKSSNDNVEPKKRSRVSEQEEAVRSSPGPSEKKATGVKRKSSNDNVEPKKRSRVSEQEEAVRSSLGPSEKKDTGVKRKSSNDNVEPKKRSRVSEQVEAVRSSPGPSEKKDTGVKRKSSNDNVEPKKRSRVSEQEEAVRSLPGPSETKETSTIASSSREDFEEKYQQLNELGAGAFGSVYAGYRRRDFIPVAIKRIPKDTDQENIGTIPLEVAIMQRLTHGQEIGKSAAISLLDYYDLDDELILVLERPVPAMDLFDYMADKDRALNEEEGRTILKQLIEGTLELQSKKVFHRDIKLENILIDTSSNVPRLRLIDFGLSCFSEKSSKHKEFYGTPEHIPPEFHKRGSYRAGPTTVWQVGIVLYNLMHWGKSDFVTSEFLCHKISISADLPEGCQDILKLCLRRNPNRRPSLEELRLHPWLN